MGGVEVVDAHQLSVGAHKDLGKLVIIHPGGVIVPLERKIKMTTIDENTCPIHKSLPFQQLTTIFGRFKSRREGVLSEKKPQ
jgi:hypothetical protein